VLSLFFYTTIISLFEKGFTSVITAALFSMFFIVPHQSASKLRVKLDIMSHQYITSMRIKKRKRPAIYIKVKRESE
jgi:hypothetical protein